MSIREWMKDNDVRSLNVTQMELSPGWRVYALRNDNVDAGITVEADSPLSDEYIFDSLKRQFASGK